MLYEEAQMRTLWSRDRDLSHCRLRGDVQPLRGTLECRSQPSQHVGRDRAKVVRGAVVRLATRPTCAGPRTHALRSDTSLARVKSSTPVES